MLYFSSNFLAIFASVLLLIGPSLSMPSDKSMREEPMDVDRTPAETICQQAREKIKEYSELAQLKEDKQVVAKAVEKLEQYGEGVPGNRKMLGNMVNMLKQFGETLPKAEIPENEKMLGTLLADYYCAKLKIGVEGGKEAENPAELDLDAEKENWTPKGLQDFSVRGEKMFDQLNRKFGVTDEQLLMSLSNLQVTKGGGRSRNLFYMTSDTKFLVKSLTVSHDEPETIQAVLDKYARYMLGEDGDRSMLSRYHLAFQAIMWKDCKEKDSAGKEIIVPRLVPLHFIVINNIFLGIDHRDLLKFDVKGTFSPGSAVQFDQKKQYWLDNNWPQGPRESVYREYDFQGINRIDSKGVHRLVEPFFNNGIEMDGELYRQLMERLDKDVEYLLDNNLNDYSLLLGVHFLPQGETASSAANCIPAKCRDCKRAPDTPYQSEHQLCLYLGLVDLLTPSNSRQQRFFRKKFKEHRNLELRSLAELTGFQLEDVSPIPAVEFAGRLLGVVAGCVFRPSGKEYLPLNSIEQFRHVLIGAICRSYGENREEKIKKLREIVARRQKAKLQEQQTEEGQQHNVKLQNEMEAEDTEAATATATETSWLRSEELQHNQGGITVHALEVFKEMMDNCWGTHSWQLLRSLSSGMFNVLQYNNQRQIELVSTKDRKYLLKRLTQKELEVFEEIFGDYFEKMAGPAGQSSLLPRYYTIVRDQRNVFVVMNNMFSPSLNFVQKFALNAEPRSPSQPPRLIYPGLLTTAPPQHGIRLMADAYKALINQLDRDATFLQEHNLMDYSMLLGLDEGKFAQNSTKQMPSLYERSLKMVLSLADILNQQPNKKSVDFQMSSDCFRKFMCMVSTKVLASESEEAMMANELKYCGGHESGSSISQEEPIRKSRGQDRY